MSFFEEYSCKLLERKLEALDDAKELEYYQNPFWKQEEDAYDEQEVLRDTDIACAILQNNEEKFKKDLWYLKHYQTFIQNIFIFDELYCERSNLINILLEDYNIYINVVDSLKRTPLMKSIISRDYKSVHILLKHGADIKCVDIYKHNALSLACMSTLEIFKLIIKKSKLPYTFFSGKNIQSEIHKDSVNYLKRDKKKTDFLDRYLDLWNFNLSFVHCKTIPQEVHSLIQNFLYEV